MALKYKRVKDKVTGHQYDVLSHKVNPEKHEVLDRYPEVSRPRPAKPNVKGKRTASEGEDSPPKAPARRRSTTPKNTSGSSAASAGGDSSAPSGGDPS